MKKLVIFFTPLLLIMTGYWVFGDYERFFKKFKKDLSKTHSTIKILVDSNSSFFVDDVDMFPLNLEKTRRNTVFDSNYGQWLWVLDSVEHGCVDLSLISLFGRKYSRSINLQSDTIIHFTAKEIPAFDIGDPEKMPVTIDSDEEIKIVRASSGCFNYFHETTDIKRTGNNYNVNFSSTRQTWHMFDSVSLIPKQNRQTTDSNFATILKNVLQSMLEKPKPIAIKRKNNGVYEYLTILKIDTNSETFYIIRNNTVFKFWNPEPAAFKSYDSLLKLAGINGGNIPPDSGKSIALFLN